MELFDDDFDVEDATIIGGVAGFVEESVREEDQNLDNKSEPNANSIEIAETSNDINLRIMRNTNPRLFAYIVKKVKEHKQKWRKNRLKKQIEIEFDHELEALAKTEALLGNEK